jgi:Co/Zn/Cd efflux system component
VADECCSRKGDTLAALAAKAGQRRVLVIVMAINLAMFFVEFGGGLAARSSALMADSVDMLGDALVYALSLYALHRGPRWEAGAAIAKGVIILGFGMVVLVEIADKLAHGIPPSSTLMLAFGSGALAANLLCLGLLWRFRQCEHAQHLRMLAQRRPLEHQRARRGWTGGRHQRGLAGHCGGHSRRVAVPALGVARAR